MSEEVIALIVMFVVIALLFAWAPFLNFICLSSLRCLVCVMYRDF